MGKGPRIEAVVELKLFTRRRHFAGKSARATHSNSLSARTRQPTARLFPFSENIRFPEQQNNFLTKHSTRG
jgi:hypothetical protein